LNDNLSSQDFLLEFAKFGLPPHLRMMHFISFEDCERLDTAHWHPTLPHSLKKIFANPVFASHATLECVSLAENMTRDVVHEDRDGSLRIEYESPHTTTHVDVRPLEVRVVERSAVEWVCSKCEAAVFGS
jgi:hypothetical protein